MMMRTGGKGHERRIPVLQLNRARTHARMRTLYLQTSFTDLPTNSTEFTRRALNKQTNKQLKSVLERT